METQNISNIINSVDTLDIDTLHHILTRSEVELSILSLRTPLDKLLKSVLSSDESIVEIYKTCMNTDIKSIINKPETRFDALADQTDAAVDIMYYTMNAASKCNLEMISGKFPIINIQYNDVKEFTIGSSLKSLPEEPVEPTRDAVLFLIKMIISELSELLQTVCEDMNDCRETISRLFGFEIKGIDFGYIDNKRSQFCEWTYNILFTNICECIYSLYGLYGNNLLEICFNEVHNANMRKKDPTTNKFIIRESDGKVIKPKGWVGPDIKRAIRENAQVNMSLCHMKNVTSSFLKNVLVSLSSQINNERGEEDLSEAANIFLLNSNESNILNGFEKMVIDE